MPIRTIDEFQAAQEYFSDPATPPEAKAKLRASMSAFSAAQSGEVDLSSLEEERDSLELPDINTPIGTGKIQVPAPQAHAPRVGAPGVPSHLGGGVEQRLDPSFNEFVRQNQEALGSLPEDVRNQVMELGTKAPEYQSWADQQWNQVADEAERSGKRVERLPADMFKTYEPDASLGQRIGKAAGDTLDAGLALAGGATDSGALVLPGAGTVLSSLDGPETASQWRQRQERHPIAAGVGSTLGALSPQNAVGLLARGGYSAISRAAGYLAPKVEGLTALAGRTLGSGLVGGGTAVAEGAVRDEVNQDVFDEAPLPGAATRRFVEGTATAAGANLLGEGARAVAGATRAAHPEIAGAEAGGVRPGLANIQATRSSPARALEAQRAAQGDETLLNTASKNAAPKIADAASAQNTAMLDESAAETAAIHQKLGEHTPASPPRRTGGGGLPRPEETSGRPTVPPGPVESAGVARFENNIARENEFKASLYNLQDSIGNPRTTATPAQSLTERAATLGAPPDKIRRAQAFWREDPTFAAAADDAAKYFDASPEAKQLVQRQVRGASETNRALRSGQAPSVVSERANKTAQALEEAVAAGHGFEGTVYRGVNVPPATLQGWLKRGEVRDDGAFVHTSADPGYAPGNAVPGMPSNPAVIMRMKTKSGVPIAGVSGQPHEQEVLIPPGRDWKITGQSRDEAGRIVLDVEEFIPAKRVSTGPVAEEVVNILERHTQDGRELPFFNDSDLRKELPKLFDVEVLPIEEAAQRAAKEGGWVQPLDRLVQTGIIPGAVPGSAGKVGYLKPAELDSRQFDELVQQLQSKAKLDTNLQPDPRYGQLAAAATKARGEFPGLNELNAKQSQRFDQYRERAEGAALRVGKNKEVLPYAQTPHNDKAALLNALDEYKAAGRSTGAQARDQHFQAIASAAGPEVKEALRSVPLARSVDELRLAMKPQGIPGSKSGAIAHVARSALVRLNPTLSALGSVPDIQALGEKLNPQLKGLLRQMRVKPTNSRVGIAALSGRIGLRGGVAGARASQVRSEQQEDDPITREDLENLLKLKRATQKVAP